MPRTYRLPHVTQYTQPNELPIAVLRNGAWLWDEEQVAKVHDPAFTIVARPRAARVAELEALDEAMREFRVAECARIAAEPVEVGIFTEKSRAYGVRYTVRGKEFSDGSFKAVVEDNLGNYLFPTEGQMATRHESIRADVLDWVENCEE